jgi:hypothetical protein
VSNPELDKFVASKAEPVITIELSVQEVNTILAALGELPHRVAHPVIGKVFEQAQKQVGPKG